MLKNPDRAIGEIELSQIVKAAAIAIGEKDNSVSPVFLRQLVDTIGDDSLMEMFEISVAGLIELGENGITRRYHDLSNQKTEVETGISNRIMESIPNVRIYNEEFRRRRLEASRGLSILSHGIFSLAGALDLSNPSSSRKS